MWFVCFCHISFHLARVAKLVHCLKLGSTEVGNVLTIRNDEHTHLAQRKGIRKFHKCRSRSRSIIVVELDPLLAISGSTQGMSLHAKFKVELHGSLKRSNQHEVSLVRW